VELPILKKRVAKTDGAMLWIFQSRQPIQENECPLCILSRLFWRRHAIESFTFKPEPSVRVGVAGEPTASYTSAGRDPALISTSMNTFFDPNSFSKYWPMLSA
jgi:hypothetical protein